MDDEYIDVKIDVFEHVGQRARLRKTLTVSALIDEILKEFDDLAADTPEKYALYLQGVDRPLNPAMTMLQLDLQPQDELVFEYVRQHLRRMLEPHQYAVFNDQSNGRVYEIQWQPALIGRPTNDPEHNMTLAVNLQAHPKGQTVSRRHAQVTFSEGRYLIEPLAENNPVAVNDKTVPPNTRREIKNGDRVLLGKNGLQLVFSTQPVPVTHKAPDSRPAIIRPEAVSPSEMTSLVTESPVLRLLIEAATAPGQVGQRLELTTFPAILGRDHPQLNTERDVSRRHAEIRYSPASGKFLLVDLQSTNGVFLDGARIEANRPYELSPGVQVGLGQNVLLRCET